MRVCSGVAYNSRGDGFNICVEAPDGSFASSSGNCPAGYNYARIPTDNNRFIGVCIPAPVQKSNPAPAPVITVNPVIQTQVSPQISPNFQQQFQPSNSPMTAGTTQSSGGSSAPSQPQGGISQADLEAALAKQRAEFAAAITQAGITSQSQQLPVVSAAPVYVPPSVPATTGDAQLPVSPLPSSVSSSGMEPVTATATTTNPTNSLDFKSMFMIGAGLLGVLLLSSNKRA